MIRQDFNSGWMFSKDISSMMGGLYGENNVPVEVTLPHDAMVLEQRDENNPSGNAGGFYPGGNYVYTKDFYMPEDNLGKTVLLEFEGVYNRANVFLNDEFVVSCHYGYTNFYADLTTHLNYGGENHLRVKVTNQDVPNSRWYTGSGIYRPVHLLIGNEAHIKQDGLKITTPEVSEDISTVETEITIRYDGTKRVKAWVETEILNDDGNVAAFEKSPVTLCRGEEVVLRQRIFIYDARLWSLEEPNLYCCLSKLVIDEEVQDKAKENFGIRHIQIDPKYGLRLNGETVKLRGACIHHDNGIIGSITLPHAEERRVLLMKKAGFNSIRMAHNSASRALLDACDKFGMLLMEETYDMWNDSKTPYDYAHDFACHWEEDLEAIVAKDYNHPSVFMYSIGNEIGEINKPGGAIINRALCEKFRSLDPTRYVTNAVNGMVATMADLMTVMSDLGMITKEQAEAMNHPKNDEAVGNAADASQDINDVMTNLMGQMNYLSIHPMVGEVLDETFSALDTCGYNYMSGRYPLDAKAYPNRIYYGAETLPPDIDINWKYAKEIPQMIGDFTWTGWDYIGEAGAGVPKYGSASGFFSPYPIYLAYVGDFDIIGHRRPMSYYREIVWGFRKKPYIAVQLPEHYQEEMHGTPWACSNAIESWTWTGFEGQPIKAEVYSDADEVELLINGNSQGRQPAGEKHRYKAVFDTVYHAGCIEAIAYTKGRETGRYEISTAGSKKILNVAVDSSVLHADGQDAAYLMIEVADEKGNVQTQFDGKVSIEVEGAGTLLGFGSADPKSTENFFDLERTPYYGRLLAVVRAGVQTGEARIRLWAEDCQETELKIEVI